MSQERILVSQENARAGISPKYGAGASILKEIIGFFLSDLDVFTGAAIDGWAQSGFIRTFEEGAQVEQGDIGDLVEKSVKMTEITLTNQNFFLLYKKGFRAKEQRLIVLPLRFAIDVETEGIIGKSVLVTFEVPQKEKGKSQRFDLALGVKHSETWVGIIEPAIHKNLPTPIEEQVLCNIQVWRRGSHALCFTQKRVIAAKIQISWLWFPPIIILTFFGLAFLGAGYFAPTISAQGRPILIILGLILLVVPISAARVVMRRRFKELHGLSPEGALAANKKNFEIPYSDITRFEVKKGRIGSGHKIKIITNSERHEFGIGKKQFKKYIGFIRSVLPDKVYVH